MHIEKNGYFNIKADTKEAIDITFSIRGVSTAKIARLHADEVECINNSEDRIIKDILFYYSVWKKIGALPVNSIKYIKNLTDRILENPKISRLNDDEYNDFMQLTKEMNLNKINIFNEE